jgi:outer membrane immunogenic protein
MKTKGLCAIAIGLMAATALCGAAKAADIVAPEVFDWTGPYIGAHVGWGWIDLDGAFDTSDVGDDSPDGPLPNDFGDGQGKFDLDDNNILGGLQAGYNVQFDQFVLGVEGDISFTDLHDKRTNVDEEKVSFDTNLLISLRARAGLAMDNLLIYATAGGAWTDTNFKAKNGPPPPDEDTSSGDTDLNDIGFVVGGGAEYAFDENWSVRAEGLYYYFNDKEDTSNLTSDSDGSDFIKLKDIAVGRIGLNFRF